MATDRIQVSLCHLHKKKKKDGNCGKICA